MKKITKTKKVTKSLESLIGKRITLFCCRYIYTGNLKAVFDDSVLLDDTGVVYETGAYTEKEWKTFQKLPYEWFVCKSAIESYGLLK